MPRRLREIAWMSRAPTVVNARTILQQHIPHQQVPQSFVGSQPSACSACSKLVGSPMMRMSTETARQILYDVDANAAADARMRMRMLMLTTDDDAEEDGDDEDGDDGNDVGADADADVAADVEADAEGEGEDDDDDGVGDGDDDAVVAPLCW